MNSLLGDSIDVQVFSTKSFDNCCVLLSMAFNKLHLHIHTRLMLVDYMFSVPSWFAAAYCFFFFAAQTACGSNVLWTRPKAALAGS